eukprot:TRINITY_DN16149_c0_g1_i1.p2 TRINITY_DN16149_c0_g1~~TRINITY_DN16149_c0_g1_i1.p2  ORF type:complete len:107 (-),score=18.85 TRINITY_DN16149_c0_g1_i1:766-1086(-)
MAQAAEQLRHLLGHYGIPATEIVNIVNRYENLQAVQNDVRDLISGHDALKALFSKSDFLENLCEKGCTDDIKQIMEAAWAEASNGKQVTDFLQKAFRGESQRACES